MQTPYRKIIDKQPYDDTEISLVMAILIAERTFLSQAKDLEDYTYPMNRISKFSKKTDWYKEAQEKMKFEKIFIENNLAVLNEIKEQIGIIIDDDFCADRPFVHYKGELMKIDYSGFLKYINPLRTPIARKNVRKYEVVV